MELIPRANSLDQFFIPHK